MQKFFIIISFLWSFCTEYCVAHLHSESSYQHAWSEKNNGIEEFVNDDKTRIDCLTNSHAVEFDFAQKWAEAVGQALYYHLKTGKRGKVILILEDEKKEKKYFERVEKLSRNYDFDVEYITPEILNIKDGECPYINCKCHKKVKANGEEI